MESCDAAFKQDVFRLCIDSLEHQAFTLFRKANVDWPLDNEFHVFVGLKAELCDEYVQVNPSIGVHLAPLMRTCAKLQGRKYDRAQPTFAIPMGEIAADAAAFRFRRSMNIQAEAARLARLYVTVGLAYARSIASCAALLPLLESRLGGPAGHPEHYACCLYLMDRADEARSFTKGFVGRRPEDFESFAGPFLKLLDERSPDSPQ